MATALSFESVLKEVWGFDSLRPLQQRTIELAMEQRDALVVMPTGGGKSLCYQLPPLLDGGLTLVVSPLISLMSDQVQGLTMVGYPAEALHSGLSPEQTELATQRVLDGTTKLVYLSPERVLTAAMASMLAKANNGQGVSRIAIDEAHCISGWGHDFRPEYRVLSRLRKVFPNAPIHALTATATPRVRQDILDQLGLREPEVLVGNFDRPNLTYRVVPKADAPAQTAQALKKHPTDAAIVYCISRKDTEEMAAALAVHGVKAKAYHAGMTSVQRQKISEDFAMERLHVVVATVAFGMGIDRSNVRCVIHASLPKSIEGYQQETGRAGRDGLDSECITLFSAGDVARWQRVIGGGDPTYEAHQMHLLDEVRRFATGVKCRHQALVEYFGQCYEGPMPCGACDVCLNAPEVAPDSTKTAQKLLATVRDIQFHKPGMGFGMTHVVSVLRGANTKPVRTHGHETIRGYGCMAKVAPARIASWIHQLIDLGFIDQSTGKFPHLIFTEEGSKALNGRLEITLYDSRAVDLSEVTTPVRKYAVTDTGELEMDAPLFEVLRAVRRQLAEDRSVPAFMILSDATLQNLAAIRPSTPEKLLSVSGIGAKKARDFGEDFLKAIADYCTANGVDTDAAEPKKKTVRKRRVKAKRKKKKVAKAKKV